MQVPASASSTVLDARVLTKVQSSGAALELGSDKAGKESLRRAGDCIADSRRGVLIGADSGVGKDCGTTSGEFKDDEFKVDSVS